MHTIKPLCILILLLSASVTMSVHIDDKSRMAKWIIMYYLCGDSHLANETGLLLENLSRIGSSRYVRIVVMLDNRDKHDTKLCYIDTDGKIRILNDLVGWPDEVDTGDVDTLLMFCKTSMYLFPAEKSALIVFSAGGAGWQLFSLYDEKTGHSPALPQFADALRQLTNDGKRKIDILYTPCITGMVEVAYELSPYVRYLVTTEEHTPDGPRHVERFYKAVEILKNNPNMSAEDFSKLAPFLHQPCRFSFYRETIVTRILNLLPYSCLHKVIMLSTCSVINLSRVKDLVESIDDLSSWLLLHRYDKETMRAVKLARKAVREYGKGYPKRLPYIVYRVIPLDIFAFDCYIDLYNFVDLLERKVENKFIKSMCKEVKINLNKTIILNSCMPGDSSYGLSIYFPSSKSMYNHYIFRGKIPCKYEDIRFSREYKWDDFLRSYLGIEE